VTVSRLAPLVRRFRIRAALSQNELARRTGCDPGWINQIELRGRVPSRKVVDDLGRALELAPVEHDRLLIAAGYCPEIVARMSERQLRAVYTLMGEDGVEPARLETVS
jgi:transcriptional regulator with XRE-family HTH domain